MRRTAWVVMAAVTAAVVVGGAGISGADGQENGDRGRAKPCSEATVRGDYGIQIQGTRPAPGGAIESVIGVVLRNYDGNGSFTQVSNVKGSITGTVPDSQGFGTYDVNADCTGTYTTLSSTGRTGNAFFVIVDNGNEIHVLPTNPGGSITCIARKVFPVGNPKD